VPPRRQRRVPGGHPAEQRRAPDLIAWVWDPAGEDAYPIATMTWLLLYTDYDDEKLAACVKDMVKYMLSDEAQGQADSLGYMPLPAEVIEKVKAADELHPSKACRSPAEHGGLASPLIWAVSFLLQVDSFRCASAGKAHGEESLSTGGIIRLDHAAAERRRIHHRHAVPGHRLRLRGC
jgi:hypothetical protein